MRSELFDLIPLNWGYVYIIVDVKKQRYYIGSHNGKNKKYLGSGLIIKKIQKHRPDDLVIYPVFWHSDINTVRKVEEEFLTMYNAKANKLFYNLTNCSCGGNVLQGKSSQEIAEIRKRAIVKYKKTWQNTPKEIKLKRAKLHSEKLKNISSLISEKIKTSLSKKSKQQKTKQQFNSLLKK